jgi:hypothetical protein
MVDLQQFTLAKVERMFKDREWLSVRASRQDIGWTVWNSSPSEPNCLLKVLVDWITPTGY